VPEVVAEVLDNPALFAAVFDGMLSQDPIVRMRSADAVEKISARHPDYLRPFKAALIHQVSRSQQQEVRWHVAQMLPRLDLSPEERATAVDILLGYLEDRSKIVKTFSMQALADLAEEDARLRPRIITLLNDLIAAGSPAMVSRGRKLLKRLKERETRS
jgi:hypothetical protein